MNKTTFAKSWKDATLFPYELTLILENISLTDLQFRSATGDLTLTGDLDLKKTIDSAESNVANVAKSAIHQIENYVESLDFEHLPALPTLNLSLNLDTVNALPDAQVHLEFDDLELYLDLDIQLSEQSTYTYPLFRTESPEGISVVGLEVGVVFGVDLVLIADEEVDIGTGIHIKLDDGVAFDLAMFSSNVSDVTIPGGSFEFLPVTITGKGALHAALSLSVGLGVEIGDSDFPSEFSSGVETNVFAYVADFGVEVDAGHDAGDSINCDLAAELEYTFALGAAAGATVAVDSHTWGPAISTTVPVWYTTLASICAETKATPVASSQITPRAALNRRDDLDDLFGSPTTTTSTYTIVNCLSQGVVNCPVNLQTTSTATSVVSVQSGSSTAAVNTITSAIPFGTNVHKLAATSGAPTSYVPFATGGSRILDGTTDGTSNKLIIGLCIGLGVPFLAVVFIGFCFYIRKRKRYTLVERKTEVYEQDGQDGQYGPPAAYDSPGTHVRMGSIPRKPVGQY
ncbi:hypothetical protein N7510_000945 [Penicillium lagena]|uniref:uncharacterized protein n=1 Tax=Penicillium lagena TaxID=94218 RepID=UPI0025411609|nr:uncharacterized protein N7510_000945 [Penicillium lagena]KAJ5624636.1 hypothetical protein N7510_000945 [Penicillium lagena]